MITPESSAGDSVVGAGRLGPVRTRLVVAAAAGGAGIAVASHHDLLPAQLGRGQRLDHVVGDLVGHLDEREAIRDLDGADERRLQPGLAADRADEIGGADAGLTACADEQAGHGLAGAAIDAALATFGTLTALAARRALARCTALVVARRRGRRSRDFVIAAYQASQVNAAGNNSAVWAQIFGAQELRNIENVQLRSNLARVMAFDYDLVNLSAVTTPYRQEVRKVIPDNIQDAIRKHCGDRRAPGSIYALKLPATCPIKLTESEVAATAAALRAKPDLQGELRWHRAAVANQLLNVETLRILLRDLTSQIAQS